jgi:hypothetical protein
MLRKNPATRIYLSIHYENPDIRFIIINIIIIIIIIITYFCVFLYTRANFVIGFCAVKFARKLTLIELLVLLLLLLLLLLCDFCVME